MSIHKSGLGMHCI